MEPVVGHFHLHRSGEVTLYAIANSQSRCDDSQPGLLYHAPCGEKDKGQAAEKEFSGKALYQRKQGGIRVCGRNACVGARRYVPCGEYPMYEVCEKTGTAQNRGRDHSAFMGFCPDESSPKIAIAVYVRMADSVPSTACLSVR